MTRRRVLPLSLFGPIALLLLLVAGLPANPLRPAQAAGSPRVDRTVYGYYPYWVDQQAYKNFRFDLLTHVAWFGVDIKTDGTLKNYGWPNRGLNQLAHANGVKVTLTATAFDWDWSKPSPVDPILAGDHQAVADALLNIVLDGGGDGINLDLEHLRLTNTVNNRPNRDQLTAFVQTVSATFKRRNPALHVTVAAPAADASKLWDYDALASATDGLMIMAYEYWFPGACTAGPTSPLKGWVDGQGYNVTRTLDEYQARTAQTNKLILGVPYYGHIWPTGGEDVGPSQCGAKTISGGKTSGKGHSVDYSEAARIAAEHGRKWEATTHTPYATWKESAALNDQTIDQWYQLWYDDATSLQDKYDLARARNLQGIGIWALGFDQGRSELWGALEAKFVPRFRMQATPNLTQIDQGTTAQIAVKTQALNGFQPQVNLTLESPVGTTVVFDRTTLETPGTATVTLAVSDRTPPGTYVLSLVAQTGGTSVSIPLTIQVNLVPPAEPGLLLAHPLTDNSVELTWADRSGNEDGWLIEAATPGSAWAELTRLPADQARYVVSGLTPNSAHGYRVTAYNAAGQRATNSSWAIPGAQGTTRLPVISVTDGV